MELKVHVDQTIRIVCGLTEQTTVHEVIVALAQALKQTGRFYLVEYCPRRLKSRPRVMAPAERPIQLLRSYLKLFASADIEFRLIRTSLTTSTAANAAVDDPLTDVLASINRQQYVLNEQTIRLGDLLESIRAQEAANTNKLDEEYFKRKLFHLDLKSKLNERKLTKMNVDINETALRKEAELNEFLKAQIDYYQRYIQIIKNLQ